jgi:phenylpyruvate tautomerase PptA (4-oxalocrotonate tautomerase family)
MPYVQIITSAQLTDSENNNLLKDVSAKVASIIGKPEQYVMVSIIKAPMIMSAGIDDAATFIDVRSIGGLTRDVKIRLTRALTESVGKICMVIPRRIFVSFREVDGVDWGWDNDLLG